MEFSAEKENPEKENEIPKKMKIHMLLLRKILKKMVSLDWLTEFRMKMKTSYSTKYSLNFYQRNEVLNVHVHIQ